MLVAFMVGDTPGPSIGPRRADPEKSEHAEEETPGCRRVTRPHQEEAETNNQ